MHLLGKPTVEKGLEKCVIMTVMKIERIKTKSYKKNKLKILSVFAIILLLLFILFDYVFIVRRSYKALAPAADQTVISFKEKEAGSNDSDIRNKSSQNQSTDLDFKDNGNINTIEEADHDAYYFAGLAKQSSNKQDWQNALDNINKALEINSNVIDFYADKSDILLRLNKKQDAIDCLREGLKKFPNSLVLQSALDQINNY